jgi:DNA-binding response OmpR family regulator
LNTTVLYANNGQEGLDVFKTNKIDIVLMDSNAGYGRVKTIAIRNGEVGVENATFYYCGNG